MYFLGNIEIICDNNPSNEDHIMNGVNVPGVNSETSVNNVDVVNNNESSKKQLNNSSKKDKTDKDKKIDNSSPSDESSEENTDNEKKQDTEIIFIQDLGFNVKIVCVGTETFEIQVCKNQMKIYNI